MEAEGAQDPDQDIPEDMHRLQRGMCRYRRWTQGAMPCPEGVTFQAAAVPEHTPARPPFTAVRLRALRHLPPMEAEGPLQAAAQAVAVHPLHPAARAPRLQATVREAPAAVPLFLSLRGSCQQSAYSFQQKRDFCCKEVRACDLCLRKEAAAPACC